VARALFAIASRTGSIQLILTYKEDKSRCFFLDLLLWEVKVIAKNCALRILCVHQRQRDSTPLISNCKLNVKFDRTQVVFPSLKQKSCSLVSNPGIFYQNLGILVYFFYLSLFQYCKICCCLPSKTSTMLLDLQLCLCFVSLLGNVLDIF